MAKERGSGAAQKPDGSRTATAAPLRPQAAQERSHRREQRRLERERGRRGGGGIGNYVGHDGGGVSSGKAVGGGSQSLWRFLCHFVKLWCHLVAYFLAALYLLSLLEHHPDPQTSLVLTGTHGWRPYAEQDAVTGTYQVYQVSNVLTREQSRWQAGEVFDTPFFGRIMLLDGDIMITERDETHYHEMLAHVPLAYIPEASNVLIIGGGDGGTLRQVLQHKNVKKVVHLEIDGMVVDLAKRYFPLLGEAYNDPRVDLRIIDGAKWVHDRARAVRTGTIKQQFPDFEQFDVILVDSTDYGNASPLFQTEFYEALRTLFKPDSGILAFNVDSPSWALSTVGLVSLQLSSIFKSASVYQAFQPTYASGHYTFMFASDHYHPYTSPLDWEAFEAKDMKLHYYTPDTHVASFALPAFVNGAVHNHVKLDSYCAAISSANSTSV